jgi:hypothetical protein
MPAWSSSYDASWGRSAAWSIASDGQSGPGLLVSRTGGGSSAKVMIYDLEADTEFTISVFMRCPSWSSTYWAEFAYRLGSHSAQDFDSNAGDWSLIKKFSTATANGNGNTWIQYALTVNSGSHTRISVGFKLGSSGSAPGVAWDTLQIISQDQTTAPAIALSTRHLATSTDTGNDAAAQTFTVANGAAGTLNYTISDDAPWLSVSPQSGTSTGEADPMRVSFATANLTAGTYNAIITVSDPMADNNPGEIEVTLIVNESYDPDFDFPGFTYTQLIDHFRYYHQRSECIYEGGGTWAALETNLSHPLVRDSSRRALGYMRVSQVESNPVYEERARAALDYLVTQQNADGHFTWWNTPSGTDNVFDCQYVTGTAAAALAEGYQLYGDARYLAASAAAARWEANAEIGWNTNYILFGVWHLAKHYGITGEQQWLDAALNKTIQAAFARQDTDGGWSEGAGVPSDLIGHNKRIWYHGIILRGLIELYRVLPADHFIRQQLRDSIQAGVQRAFSMQQVSGEIDVGSGIPNEHRNAFILEALLMAYDYVGIDTRDAVRGIMQYRMDFSRKPYQVVGFNIDIQSIGYLMQLFDDVIPEPPAEPPPTPVPPMIQIGNPDFEDDGGFFNLAEGWQTFGYGKREGFLEAGHGWVQALADYPEGSRMGVYQFVGGVQPGETYRFAVQAKTTSSELAASIGVADTGTHGCHEAIFSDEHNGSQWDTLSVEVTATQPWTTLFLQGRNTDPYRISFARVLFDHVTFEPLGDKPTPAIGLNTAFLIPTAEEGTSPPDDTFHIYNTGGGVLNYNISDDVSWLSVSPTSGAVTDATHVITVKYATAGLAAGTYSGTIIASDPNAANDPQTINVTLTVTPVADDDKAVAESFESMPNWFSGWDAGWGTAASWTVVAGGQSGNALQATRSSGGSSSKVAVYTIAPDTDYTISVTMRSPGGSSGYWAECAYRLGRYSAQDFDENGAAWNMVNKFSASGSNGNENQWHQYERTFNSGSHTQISVGFKLGSSGSAPAVQWDSLRIE